MGVSFASSGDTFLMMLPNSLGICMSFLGFTDRMGQRWASINPSRLSSEVGTFFFYRGKTLPPPLLGVGACQQKWSGPQNTSAPACGGLLSRSFYTNSPTHPQITQPTSFNRVRGLRIMYKYNGLFSDKQRPTAVRGPASDCVRRV